MANLRKDLHTSQCKQNLSIESHLQPNFQQLTRSTSQLMKPRKQDNNHKVTQQDLKFKYPKPRLKKVDLLLMLNPLFQVLLKFTLQQDTSCRGNLQAVEIQPYQISTIKTRPFRVRKAFIGTKSILCRSKLITTFKMNLN